MIRRPPRSTQSRSSAASDVYKRQLVIVVLLSHAAEQPPQADAVGAHDDWFHFAVLVPVSYTHLRAHETPEHLVCRLLLEKKKKISQIILI